MTQYKVNKAYPALMRLAELRLPFKKAKMIYEMSKKADDHLQFAIAEERKYISEFGGEERPDKTVSFSSQNNFRKYQEKILELNDLEVQWDSPIITLTESDIGDQTITPADILSLEGFVAFE